MHIGIFFQYFPFLFRAENEVNKNAGCSQAVDLSVNGKDTKQENDKNGETFEDASSMLRKCMHQTS